MVTHYAWIGLLVVHMLWFFKYGAIAYVWYAFGRLNG